MNNELKQQVALLLVEADPEVFLHFFHSQAPIEREHNSYDVKKFMVNASTQGITWEYCTKFNGGDGVRKDYWSVYKFTKETDSVYVKFSGWYESNKETGFDRWHFVEPKEVICTEYV